MEIQAEALQELAVATRVKLNFLGACYIQIRLGIMRHSIS